MCVSKPKNTTAPTPAAAPPPALPAADAPEVGDARRRENTELHGGETPNYRVQRKGSVPVINPNNPITM